MVDETTRIQKWIKENGVAIILSTNLVVFELSFIWWKIFLFLKSCNFTDMNRTISNSSLVNKLKNRSIKPTAMRLLVLEYLVDKDAAVNLSDVEQHFSRSDRTTLYRTLKTFEDKGLVHEIHDLSGSAKYALCSDDCSCTYPEDIHVHFYCNSCKKTFCFPDRSVPSINLPKDYQAVSGDFVINGLCPACRNWLLWIRLVSDERMWQELKSSLITHPMTMQSILQSLQYCCIHLFTNFQANYWRSKDLLDERSNSRFMLLTAASKYRSGLLFGWCCQKSAIAGRTLFLYRKILATDR